MLECVSTLQPMEGPTFPKERVVNEEPTLEQIFMTRNAAHAEPILEQVYPEALQPVEGPMLEQGKV